jgi:hypothetical protein
MDSKIETQYTEIIKDNGEISPVNTIEYDQKTEKRLIRRVDKRLLPILELSAVSLSLIL